MNKDKRLNLLKIELNRLYNRYNRREFIHPDPLEFLYHYDDIYDREIVAIIASSLAYGKVSQILKSISSVLKHISPPSLFLKKASLKSLNRTFYDFKHRFTKGEELAILLFGVKKIIEKYGSLKNCFIDKLSPNDDTIFPALSKFIDELIFCSNGKYNSLIPSPKKGSALKRLNLFMRWMVRKDEVDPGGWEDIPKSMLIIPLDTHMHKISLLLGLTKRKQADLKTAFEITKAFKGIAPDDPVKYDFALTRLGIREEINTDHSIKDFIMQRA